MASRGQLSSSSCSCSLLLPFLLFIIAHCSPAMELTTGQLVMIPVPTCYQDGFVGRAFLAMTDDAFLPFRAALSVEGAHGEYLCSLVVLLGDVKVWASDHLSKFPPKNRCALEVSEEREVRLVDSGGTVGWSSKPRGQLAQKLCLLKTGNLLLLDSKNHTKWQSFDHPGDTLLWSQVLAPPSILTTFLTSLPSLYSFEIQQDRLTLYLNINNSKYSYWDLRTKNNRSISFARLGSTGLKLFGKDEQNIGQLKTEGTEPVRFLRLGRSGALALYYYSAQDVRFKASYQAPKGLCDLPFPCGPYGICMHTSSCSCLSSSSKQNDTRVACKYDAFLHNHPGTTESTGTKMKEIDGVGTILRTEPQKTIGSGRACMVACRDNSSCHAAMYIHSSRECFHYCTTGGIREIGKEAGVTSWVKVPSMLATGNNGTKRTKEILMVVAIVVDGVALCFILGGLLFYIRRKRASTRIASS